MRPYSKYLEVLKSEVYKGKHHLGGSTPYVVPLLLQKPIKISLDPTTYPQQLLSTKRYIAKASKCRPDQISVVTGSTQACFQLLAAITEPGDSIIIEAPGYEPFLAAAEFLGLNILRYQRSDDLEKDLPELKRLKAKVLLISNPHCPTGWTYSASSLEKLNKLDLQVIVDEVFLPMFTKGSLSHYSESTKDFVFLSGLSKSAGLGVCRIGWTISTPEIAKKMHHIGLHLETDMPQPLLPVADVAFKNFKAIIKTLQQNADANRKPVLQFLKAHPGLLSNDFKKPFFAMLKKPPQFVDGDAFAHELLTHGILVRAGSHFEMPGWIRFHALHPPKLFAQAFSKIASYYSFKSKI